MGSCWPLLGESQTTCWHCGTGSRKKLCCGRKHSPRTCSVSPSLPSWRDSWHHRELDISGETLKSPRETWNGVTNWKLGTVKLVLRDHCHEGPPVLKDHQFLAESQCTFQCKLTCYRRPPVLKDHIFMANGVVFHPIFHRTPCCYLQRN